MLYNMIHRIDRTRFNLTVFSLIDGALRDKIEKLGVPVYVFDIKKGGINISKIIKLIRKLKIIRPDIIHAWMYHASLISLLGSCRNTRIIWSIHNSLYSLKNETRMTALIIKMCAYFSDYPSVIHYVSKFSSEQHWKSGYNKQKTTIIPNGFDTMRFRPSEGAKRVLCSELGIPNYSILIGMVARYHPVKDHDNFLSAASLISKKHNDVYFVLVGKDADKYNEKLNKKIHDMGLSTRIFLLGERTDIPMITSSFDIACSTSYSEAFPMVIGEAMASGVPCVVTDVGDSSQIVGDTGLVIPPRNHFLLAEALSKMIDLGPDGRRILGQNARNRIDCNYDLPEIVKQYEDLYVLLCSTLPKKQLPQSEGKL